MLYLLGLLSAILSIIFGSFSAGFPQQSIALYQRLMRAFNWDVHPIDARWERRATRLGGCLLVILGATLLLTLGTAQTVQELPPLPLGETVTV